MKPAYAGAAVCLLAIAVYVPGLPGDFVYDDHRLIVGNDGLKRPLDLRRAFLRDYYASDTDRIGLGYYRPIAVLSTELDYRSGGGSSLPFHMTNVALHAACTLLVFLLAIRLLGGSVPLSALASVLFALHASHAESVAFISGRVDPLATLFSLGAVLLHLRANRASAPWGWRASAGAAWLAALLSKEVAAVLPGIVLLLEASEEGWPDRAGLGRRIARYAPYAVAAALYAALRAAALGVLISPGPEGAGLSLVRPFLVLGSYLAWLVLPPPGLHLEPPLPSGAVAAALGSLALASAVGALFLWRRGFRLEAALLGSCILALLPVSQLKPLETALSERFLYLPSAVAVLFVTALASRAPAGGGRAAAMGGLALLAMCHAAILLPRVETWRSELALWKAKEREEGGSLKARLNLAQAYARRGDEESARRWYEATKEIAPALAPGLDAEVSALEGQVGSAEYESTLRKALEALPEDGALWSNLGFHLFQQGKLDEARDAFSRAIALTPMRATAWLGLALTHLRAGQVDQAAETASRAMALDPGLGLARAVLAECRVRQGRPCEALRLSEGLALEATEEQGMLERVRAAARTACEAGGS